MNNINYLELIVGNIDKLIVVGILILSSLAVRQYFLYLESIS